MSPEPACFACGERPDLDECACECAMSCGVCSDCGAREDDGQRCGWCGAEEVLHGA